MCIPRMALLMRVSLVVVLVLGTSAGSSPGAEDGRTTMLRGSDSDDFFRTASASISHDKNVLKRLEKHPLAHASGWNIQETQLPGQGWTESSKAAGPRLGGRAWEKKNDQLEKELERMSDSVNVMFKDQSNKRRYRKDEDKLFNQAVHALKVADKLYPDQPGDNSGSLSGLGLNNADSSFAHDEGRRQRSRATGSRSRSSGQVATRATVRRNKQLKDWYFGPSVWELSLVLLGCTMLAAAAWIGFMFFRRKAYYDLRVDRDRPEGIEVP
mmetsp:Transcript_50537/g.118953  ORF Transcript_50537/g.118953 Transcript_50537/m.118953 type:complete len:269 (+) Transcript_50537:372-1178(+)